MYTTTLKEKIEALLTGTFRSTQPRRLKPAQEACLWRASGPVVEAVEARRLLSVTLTSGVLVVTGGTGADAYIIYQNGTNVRVSESLNGAAATIHGPWTNTQISSRIEVSTLGGDDTVQIGNDATPGSGDTGVEETFKLLLGDGNDSMTDGGDLNDTIEGGNGTDTLRGYRGADDIKGDAGNDTITGGDGTDTILGGAGADDAEGNEAADLIYGDVASTTTSSSGNGTGSEDSLRGDSGDDTIYGQASNDTIFGGAGDDFLYGDFASTSYGSIYESNDELWGDAGGDRLRGDSNGVAQYYGTGDDYLNGGDNSDTIYGENDSTSGYGVDTIDGGAAADTVYGGFGNDLFQMTDGFNDYIDGGDLVGDEDPLSDFDGTDTRVNF